MATSFTAWIVDCEDSRNAGRGVIPLIRLLTKEDILQRVMPEKDAADKLVGTSTGKDGAKAGAGKDDEFKNVFIDPKEVFPAALFDIATHVRLASKGGLKLDDELVGKSTGSFLEFLGRVCECRLLPLLSHQDIVDDIRARQILAATASRLNTGVLPGPRAPPTRDELGALVEADQASLDALSEGGDGEDSEDDDFEDSKPRCSANPAPAGGNGGFFSPAWIPDVQALFDDEDCVEPLAYDTDVFNPALLCDSGDVRDPYEGCEFKGYFQHKLFEFEDLQSNNDFAHEFVSVPVLKQFNDPQCMDKSRPFTLSANEARIGMRAIPVVIARVLRSRIYNECNKLLVQRRQEYLVMEEEEKKRKKLEQAQEKLAREQKLREEEERKEARRQAIAAKQEREREMQRALLEQKEQERRLKKQAIQERKRQQELEKQQRREDRRRRAAEKKAQSLEKQASESNHSEAVSPLSYPTQKLATKVEPQSDQSKGGQSISANLSKQYKKNGPVFAPTKPEYSKLFDAIFKLAQQELIPEQRESLKDQRISLDVLRAQNTNLQEFAVKLPPDYIVSQCPAASIIEETQKEEKACTEICQSPPQAVFESPSLDTLDSESEVPTVSKEEELDIQNNSEVEQSSDEMSNDAVISESCEEQISSSCQESLVTEIQNEEVLEMDQLDPQYLAFFDSLPLHLFNANTLHPVPLPSYDLN